MLTGDTAYGVSDSKPSAAVTVPLSLSPASAAFSRMVIVTLWPGWIYRRAGR